jgi:predicted NACHT family NTPase
VDFSWGELRLLLEGGGAVLLLDGVDEVRPSRQKDCIADILTLADRYPASLIVVSSRTRVAGAENFAGCAYYRSRTQTFGGPLA